MYKVSYIYTHTRNQTVNHVDFCCLVLSSSPPAAPPLPPSALPAPPAPLATSTRKAQKRSNKPVFFSLPRPCVSVVCMLCVYVVYMCCVCLRVCLCVCARIQRKSRARTHKKKIQRKSPFSLSISTLPLLPSIISRKRPFPLRIRV